MSNFLQAARHTAKDERLPHQDAAWAYAWECLTPEERSEFLSIFRAAVPSKAGDVEKQQQAPRSRPTQQVVKAEVGVWRTKVKALNLSQPDASTCQATCIGMAVGDRDVSGIRSRLLRRGQAGDPAVMSAIVREYPNVRYEFVGNASLRQAIDWLKAGELLITHGWFTRSGHVILLDGVAERPSGAIEFDVKDPYSEFNARSWAYDLGGRFFDGFYSDRLIHSTCVAGTSNVDARYRYQNKPIDLSQSGMWVHRFRV